MNEKAPVRLPAEALKASPAVGGEILGVEALGILNNTEIHGDAFEIAENSFAKLDRTDLFVEGLSPNTWCEVEGVKYAFSSMYDIGEGRVAVVAYVAEKNSNTYTARSYYRSNSQGSWRYMPFYYPGKDGTINWYGKTEHEETLCLPIAVQKQLASLSEKKPITVTKPAFVFGGLSRRYAPSDTMLLVDKQGSSLLNDFTQQEMSQMPKGGLVAPEDIVIEAAKKPDFSKLVDTWTQELPLYGTVTSEVFATADKKFRYIFNRDRKGRAWIAGVEDDSQIGPMGLRKSWLKLGSLGVPAYEYISQSGKYGNPHDLAGEKKEYCDMDKMYLSKIPLIQEYQTARAKRLAQPAAAVTAGGAPAERAETPEWVPTAADKADLELCHKKLAVCELIFEGMNTIAQKKGDPALVAMKTALADLRTSAATLNAVTMDQITDPARLNEIKTTTDLLLSKLPVELESDPADAAELPRMHLCVKYSEGGQEKKFRIDDPLTKDNAQEQFALLALYLPNASEKLLSHLREATTSKVETADKKGNWFSRVLKETGAKIKNTAVVAGTALGILYKTKPQLEDQLAKAKRSGESDEEIAKLQAELDKTKLTKDQREKLLNVVTVGGFVPGAIVGALVTESVMQMTRDMGVDPRVIRSGLSATLVGVPLISGWLWAKLSSARIPGAGGKLNDLKNTIADGIRKFSDFLGVNPVFKTGVLVGAGLSPWIHAAVMEGMNDGGAPAHALPSTEESPTSDGSPQENNDSAGTDSTTADQPADQSAEDQTQEIPEPVHAEVPAVQPVISEDISAALQQIAGEIDDQAKAIGASVGALIHSLTPDDVTVDNVNADNVTVDNVTADSTGTEEQSAVQTPSVVYEQSAERPVVPAAPDLSPDSANFNPDPPLAVAEQPVMISQHTETQPTMWDSIAHAVSSTPEGDKNAIVDGVKDFEKAIGQMLGFDPEAVQSGSTVITIDSLPASADLSAVATDLAQFNTTEDNVVFGLTDPQRVLLADFLQDAYSKTPEDRSPLEQFVAQHFNALPEVGGDQAQALTTDELATAHQDEMKALAAIAYGADVPAPVAVAAQAETEHVLRLPLAFGSADDESTQPVSEAPAVPDSPTVTESQPVERPVSNSTDDSVTITTIDSGSAVEAPQIFNEIVGDYERYGANAREVADATWTIVEYAQEHDIGTSLEVADKETWTPLALRLNSLFDSVDLKRNQFSAMDAELSPARVFIDTLRDGTANLDQPDSERFLRALADGSITVEESFTNPDGVFGRLNRDMSAFSPEWAKAYFAFLLKNPEQTNLNEVQQAMESLLDGHLPNVDFDAIARELQIQVESGTGQDVLTKLLDEIKTAVGASSLDDYPPQLKGVVEALQSSGYRTVLERLILK